MEQNLKNKFVSNLSYAFIAQIVAMMMSLGVNFILPKYIGELDFSYWQLFIFYTQYIPFLHLGINDGVYLRYGGENIEELNKKAVKSQLLVAFLYQLVFSIIICIVSSIVMSDWTRYQVVFLAVLFFLVYTVQNYLGYVFQAINETYIYSKSVLISRIIFLSIIFANIFMFHQKSFFPFSLGYIISFSISLAYLAVKGKSILFEGLLPILETLKELKLSISAGSKLMLANIASMLILGIGRQFIDMKWGILEFGKISFAITITNFVLTFIQQIGMVMFPMLRKVSREQQRNIYILCRDALFLILPIIYIGYFPLAYILNLWLPEYRISVRYLILLLPICFFDTKMQMLCNTYLKVLREEAVLFKINIVSMVISLLLTGIGVWIFNDLNIVVISMTFAIALRSFIAELYLEKQMFINNYSCILLECLFTIVFIVVTWNIGNMIAFSIIVSTYFVLISFNTKKLKKLILLREEYHY